MTFLHPEFLYYMLPPLFLLFALLLTQKEAHADFFSKEVMDRLRVGKNRLTLKRRNILFLLMGFFMIVALAQPAIKDGLVEVKAKSADIMVAIDISDSMLATDIYPNRLEASKQKLLRLLGESLNERIGIIAFAKNSYLLSPLSFDTNAVAFLLRQLNTSSITEKGTDFLSVLEVFGKTDKSSGKKYLLILSDGGDKSDFSKEIELAKKHNIVVFVLGIATKKGSPIKLQDGTLIKHNGEVIISQLNEKIADLATKTGGVYIQSTTSSDDIKRMFQEIMSVSQEKELKSEEIQRHTPLFYYPLGMALLILLIATSSLSRSKNIASVFMLSFFLFSSQHLEAGVLDFMDLKKAKEAYESGEYEKAAKLYEEHAQSSSNERSYYNAANAYYKDKKYKEAIELYKKATFKEEELRAKNFSNLGNAYAKDGDLQQALEAYKSSLEIFEDKDTRDNMQEVEKLLKEQERDSKDSEQENQEDKEPSDKDKSKKEDKSEGSDKGDEKEEKEEESEKREESDKKDDSKEARKEPDKKESKDEKSDNDEKQKKDENSSSAQVEQKDIMSDEEQMKWLKELSGDSSTYLYKLNEEEGTTKNQDEKPW
ncbi:VWA domain-containing protein [Sulfurimonas sp.]|uniref:VWA domain-containing protein n=1 Tax=Sulfurimonas sp. TaxID=2022749 RepID=UPI0025EC9F3E|nr:VWA domain-containing protein [Sulfurimonas sp.]MCK9454426.1 VWA domain-containing protein [Sulfurimonas sp.]